ncbi:MAG TPA: hypothetical protein VK337_10060 [Xanthobacteraceae bacterium]|nr:hypothetical protein [Xanthobacteraceae bacterium]
MPAPPFRLFAQACLGIVVGVLLGLAIARLAFPADGRPATVPDGLLAWTLPAVWLKPREKGFYLLSLVLGGMFGYFATYRILPGRLAARNLLWALIVSVPVVNLMIAHTLGGGSFLIPGIAALGLGAVLATLIYRRGKPLVSTAASSAAAPDIVPTLWPYFAILAIMTLLLIPSSFAAVAAKIGLNHHPVAFVIGPALYFLGNGLLPGIDYYTQYSIGYPWLFHFVMGQSAGQAVIACVTAVIIATWLFYAHLIYLLQWLYRSWTVAAIVAFIPLLLGFIYPAVFPSPFLGPSNGVLRYPLLTVCAVLTSYWAETPARPARLGSIAAATGLAIFLEIESGIVMLLAAPMTLFLIHPWRSSIIPPILAFFAISLAVFAAIIFAVYGSPALQIEFLRRLFEGVILYGASGFSAWPANWTLWEWNWLYHFVGPGALLATITVIVRTSNLAPFDKRRMAVLGFLAVSGLMLLAKYGNMSLGAIWQMSSIGPFCILGWWCIALIRRIDPNIIVRGDGYVGLPRGVPEQPKLPGWREREYPLRSVVTVGMIVLAVAFIYSPSEDRNPGRYGLRAWSNFPSLLKWPFARPKGCVQMDCVANLPAASDVALITSRTQPHEQVAIVLDNYDWSYLLAAQRPPLMPFLPSAQIFTRDLLEVSLQRINSANYLFVPKGTNGEPDIPLADFSAVIVPLLETKFQKDGEGERLVAWKRVTVQGENGPR